MRLKQGDSDSESEELKKFAKWVLDIGNGQVSPPRVCNFPVTGNQILIPSQFCDVQTENTVDNIICSTYPNFLTKGTVHKEFGGTDEDLNEAFPIEYLNSLNVAGMSPHDLKLKVRAVVMLMRNLNQNLGLCNGTRMIVTKCLRFCVECEVICDCYAMTINKSQGQSLKTVGLYLPKSVFSHGQYYVAISRVTSPTGLTIFVDDESGAATNITQNVVYKEVFYGLPEA
ncbi:uncharacterized protein LOC141702790 [Apium graveolens]|uniref:uncharacterized protein LOC141702790 n=1 Tax=Apium graveolens TaxID=4045 RepID=UPI003D7A5084